MVSKSLGVKSAKDLNLGLTEDLIS